MAKKTASRPTQKSVHQSTKKTTGATATEEKPAENGKPSDRNTDASKLTPEQIKEKYDEGLVNANIKHAEKQGIKPRTTVPLGKVEGFSLTMNNRHVALLSFFNEHSTPDAKKTCDTKSWRTMFSQQKVASGLGVSGGVTNARYMESIVDALTKAGYVYKGRSGQSKIAWHITNEGVRALKDANKK